MAGLLTTVAAQGQNFTIDINKVPANERGS
jgi:hypothetical protein